MTQTLERIPFDALIESRLRPSEQTIRELKNLLGTRRTTSPNKKITLERKHTLIGERYEIYRSDGESVEIKSTPFGGIRVKYYSPVERREEI